MLKNANTTTKKWCHSPSDIPTCDHYAIIEFAKIYVDGDERSKQHPGHGYPAHTINYESYVSFTDREEWENEIRNRMRASKNGEICFSAIIVSVPNIQTTVEISIS